MSKVFLNGSIYSFKINNNIFISQCLLKILTGHFCFILTMSVTIYTENKNTCTVEMILEEK